MATSMSRSTMSVFRCFQGLLMQSCACSRLNHLNVAYKSHQATHVINYRRTKGEIARALRKKPNFLHYDLVDKHRHSPLQKGTENIDVETGVKAPRDYRFVMPEFMPCPEWERRDRVLEKLERRDMLRRRAVIDLPEFYVGSIMAVTVSDPHAPGKQNRFVGICIDRGDQGLRAYFVLRNVVDGLGVEVMYEMYNPTILSIEVLKLEKRVDEQLYYLRDAAQEHSTFSFDMEPVQLPRGSEVPVNTMKVKLKPRREWEHRWELYNLQGVEPYELSARRAKRVPKSAQPWKQHDLMRDYRAKVNEDEEEVIMAEVYKAKQEMDSQRKSLKTMLKKRK